MAYELGIAIVPSILAAFLFSSGAYDLLVSKLNKYTITKTNRRKRKRRNDYLSNSELQSRRFGSGDKLVANSRFDILSQEYEMRQLDREDLSTMYQTKYSTGGLDNSTEEMYGKILKLAIPAILNNIVRMMMEVINLSMIGQLNNTVMVAGVGMGNMTINMLGLSLIMGFNSALDTLIS